MQIEIKKHLCEALAAINNIEEYTQGLDYEGFLEKGIVRAAVERKFEIIGESLNRIRRIDPSVSAKISEHQRIIGFRNVLIHGYDIIDPEIVWDAITNHLPKLKSEKDINNGSLRDAAMLDEYHGLILSGEYG